ncbi:hypothetical protein SAMN02799630_05494 [Paenibacillus sp. UNCCL117]|nr:hypothetical protein SAMN04488602_13322 [Paenibacillus sp. cl123]SFW66342.1 hypothetical protein SAMN02799630_05494 [Paenibacillus sp. UNCCL117]
MYGTVNRLNVERCTYSVGDSGEFVIEKEKHARQQLDHIAAALILGISGQAQIVPDDSCRHFVSSPMISSWLIRL